MTRPLTPESPSDGAAALGPRVVPRNTTLAILALMFGALAIGMTELGSMGVLPLIAGAVDAPIAQAGSLISAYALGVVVGAPLLAIVGARFPRRALLLAFLGLFVLTHAALLLADDLSHLWVLRFLCGFPHGAYLGVASLVAADIVPLAKRTTAVAVVFLGFPAANLVASPIGVYLSQQHGWVTLYLLAAMMAVLAAVGILAAVPHIPRDEAASPNPLAELGILRRPKVLLTMLTTVVGFGGSFASMSFVTPMFTEVATLPEAGVPFIMVAYGFGAVLGTALAAWLARGGVARAVTLGFAGLTVVLTAFGFMAHTIPTAFLAVILMPTCAAALVPLLQTRLMEVADGGQTLAATLNHAMLNAANAIGAWAAGVTLSLGLDYTWPSRAGAVLALAGTLVAWVAWRHDRRHPDAPAPSPSARQTKPFAR